MREKIESARSLFIRTVFDLPRSTSHELSLVLFNLPPVKLLILERKVKFHASLHAHTFSFVRDAIMLDEKVYLNNLYGWYGSLVSILRHFNHELNTSDLNVQREYSRIQKATCDRDIFVFCMIKESEQNSLSFFRLFSHPETLISFRVYFDRLEFDQKRVLLMFVVSSIRWRLTPRGCSKCYFCSNELIWEHFFLCRKVVRSFPSTNIFYQEFLVYVALGEWPIVIEFIRVVLNTWVDALPDATICPDDTFLVIPD